MRTLEQAMANSQNDSLDLLAQKILNTARAMKRATINENLSTYRTELNILYAQLNLMVERTEEILREQQPG